MDFLAGSYYVESLTQRMEFESYKYFEAIEKLGGVIPAIEKGFFQKEIAEAAYRYQKDVDEKRRIVVGVNEYVVDEEMGDLELRRPDPEFELKKIRELKRLKKDREPTVVGPCLDDIRKACNGSDNVMPVLIRASKARVTLGEMIGVMKEAFGGYQDMPIF